LRFRRIENEEIKRILVGTPSGDDLKAVIELDDEVLILNHAAVSNLLRGFSWVIDHPTLNCLEMRLEKVDATKLKEGYSEYQLIETKRSEADIQKELDNIFRQSGAK
jgi:GTPase